MPINTILVSVLILGITGNAGRLLAHTNASEASNSRSSIAPIQPKENESVARNFDVQKLAEGVYAVVRKEPPGFMVDANNVFIINDDDVVVVDSNGASSITTEVLAALRKLTSKPV